MKKHKYLFVIGGVMSGVGKGVASASIGKILQARGFVVNPIKIDPYLNVDAGTMNPVEHGEVFVLSTGLECDQDMGNYERFLDAELENENYMTNGMVFKTVIDRERAMGYGGKCVEPVFHITEEILSRISKSAQKRNADVTIIEIGGTVGEYQNAIFIEAARTLKLKNPADVGFVMVSYLPIPGTLGEMKTKPTQNAIRTLNSYGVHPDIIIGRAARPLDEKRKTIIADFCNIPYKNIISAPDVKSIYDVPINFEKDGLSQTLEKLLKLRSKNGSDMVEWKSMSDRVQSASDVVKIGMIGKYFKTGDFVLTDVYISIIESLKHAAGSLNKKIELEWLDALDFEKDPARVSNLEAYDGILVPGGFGSRAIEGKLNAIRFVREKKIPYFGICYGMQLALVEFARTVMKLDRAHTAEVDHKTPHPVVDLMPEQIKNLKDQNYGGTMRLGAYQAALKKGTIAYAAYASSESGRWTVSKTEADPYLIKERHRHRYEVNPDYIDDFRKNGVVFSGASLDGHLMEIMELSKKEHPFFIGTQYHPEFTGSFMHPHPLFSAFIKAAIKK
ncbi:CTP synthase [Candidatus Uhrbacteria bacterium]|nr:CTP synthase [Candidatus Uhrbacteria bacterium]